MIHPRTPQLSPECPEGKSLFPHFGNNPFFHKVAFLLSQYGIVHSFLFTRRTAVKFTVMQRFTTCKVKVWYNCTLGSDFHNEVNSHGQCLSDHSLVLWVVRTLEVYSYDKTQVCNAVLCCSLSFQSMLHIRSLGLFPLRKVVWATHNSKSNSQHWFFLLEEMGFHGPDSY